MTPHKLIPVPLAFGEPERPMVWRCACGLERPDPTPRLTDDCPALSLPLVEVEK